AAAGADVKHASASAASAAPALPGSLLFVWASAIVRSILLGDQPKTRPSHPCQPRGHLLDFARLRLAARAATRRLRLIENRRGHVRSRIARSVAGHCGL